MRAKRLEFYHNSDNCDGEVAICLLTLMEGFELLVDGICKRCVMQVRTAIPLEKLILMTPNPKNLPFWKPPLQKNLKKELNSEDIEFFKSLGISILDKKENKKEDKDENGKKN